MKEKDIRKILNKYSWEKWIERPAAPFIISLFTYATTEEVFRKAGVPNAEQIAILFQKGSWYNSDELKAHGKKLVTPFLDKNSIFKLTSNLKIFYNHSKKALIKIKKKKNPIEQFKQFYKIIAIAGSHMFLSHLIEHYYDDKLLIEVPKYIKKDIGNFIGAASFPKKKTAHVLMEDMIRKKIKPEIIAKKYGWLRVRDAVSDPFTAKDIKQIKLHKPEKQPKVNIPSPLKPLFKEIRELVFYRTYRADIFYELIYLARPILKKVAKYYKIPFKELKNYPAQSLISGKLEKIEYNFTYGCYKGNYFFSRIPLVKDNKQKEHKLLTGNIAYPGKIIGKAKILRSVLELNKVEKGDILVTQMTFPTYLPAMYKAAAFVTDEGGITCHAAIIAREMKKPCIIGTKIATKIFKDGDLVEVDANKGVVRKLK